MTDSVHEYYCSLRPAPSGGAPSTIYQIWEQGGAFNDSVTPSTYCHEYRSHMALKIVSLAKAQDRVLSIGCGNGFVEAELSSRGLRVQAIDCNSEAVDLTAAKGVEAFMADYFSLPTGFLSSYDVVYADGLLGHLYDAQTGLEGFFQNLQRLRPHSRAWLVLSNDAPLQPGMEVAPHGRVSDFWLLSRGYLTRMLTRFGFENWESYHFPYFRPLSGLRNRTICIARVGSGEQAAM